MKERIKKLRKALDLTQQEFANRIGSVQNTITGYETGRRVPSNQVISLICREFNVNEIWLRTGGGEMFVPSPTSELDALVARYPQMTPETRVFIEKLVGLPESSQRVIMDFLRDVVDGFKPDIGLKSSTSHEMTADELHAELDRQLAEEKEAEEKSGVS